MARTAVKIDLYPKIRDDWKINIKNFALRREIVDEKTYPASE